MACELRKPSLALLPAYAAALERGWSPDNLRPAVAGEQLEKIAADLNLKSVSLECWAR